MQIKFLFDSKKNYLVTMFIFHNKFLSEMNNNTFGLTLTKDGK